MTCTHALNIILLYYVIFDITIYNKIIIFHILNDHGAYSNQRTLILTLNVVICESLRQNNSNNQ